MVQQHVDQLQLAGHQDLAQRQLAAQHEAELQQAVAQQMPLEQQQRREALLATIDALNRRYGRGTVQWAACGLQPAWMMRRSRLSRAATTRLSDLPWVQAG